MLSTQGPKTNNKKPFCFSHHHHSLFRLYHIHSTFPLLLIHSSTFYLRFPILPYFPIFSVYLPSLTYSYTPAPPPPPPPPFGIPFRVLPSFPSFPLHSPFTFTASYPYPSLQTGSFPLLQAFTSTPFQSHVAILRALPFLSILPFHGLSYMHITQINLFPHSFTYFPRRSFHQPTN